MKSTASPARNSVTSWPSSTAVRAIRRPSAARVGFSGPLTIWTKMRATLRVGRHGEELVARHLPDELGVVARDVLLGVRNELVVVGALDRVPALAVDLLGHRRPFVVRARLSTRRRG